MSYPKNHDDEGMDDAAEHVTAEQLVEYVGKMRKREADRKIASAAVTETRREAKSLGIDPRTFSTVVRLSKLDPEERERELFLLKKYAALLKYL